MGQAGRPLETGSEFHWANGIYFARVAELAHKFTGGVRLRHIRKELIALDGVQEVPHSEQEVCSEFFIPAAEWASIVAAVTPEGDNATTYRMACGLHGVRSTPMTV